MWSRWRRPCSYCRTPGRTGSGGRRCRFRERIVTTDDITGRLAGSPWTQCGCTLARRSGRSSSPPAHRRVELYAGGGVHESRARPHQAVEPGRVRRLTRFVNSAGRRGSGGWSSRGCRGRGIWRRLCGSCTCSARP